MTFGVDVRAAFRRGDSDAVVRMSEAELRRAREAADPAGEVEALYSLARVAARNGDLLESERLASAALGVALDAGDRALEERPRHVLAAVTRMSGDLSRARGLYEASIELNQELGRPEAANSEVHNLGFTELGLGNVARARELFTASREAVFLHRWDAFLPYVCVAGAALALAEGDPRRAALLTGAADGAFEAIGQVPDPDDAAELNKIRTAVGTGFDADYARGRTLDPRSAFAS